jgi:hypothetical protein
MQTHLHLPKSSLEIRLYQRTLTEGEETGISTVDFLVLTNLDLLIFILKILFTFLQTSYLNEEVNVLSIPLQLVFPGYTYIYL